MLANLKILFAVVSTLSLLVDCSIVKNKDDKPENKQDTERLKRETLFSTPIYFDSIPYQAAQPTPGVPGGSQTPQQQQSLPILGALISNVPGLNGISSTLTTLLPLGNLGNLGGLGGLGGLGNLGNLGGLGGLGGLGNLGGTLGNLGLGNLGGLGNLPLLGNLGGLLSGSAPRCSATQTLNCRCESVLPQTPAARSSEGLDVLQQNIKFNINGDKEVSARLSNGLLLYQRSGIEKLANNKSSKVIQGFYSFKVKDNKYLTIYYTINDLDYTVKADVTAEPPQNDLDGLTATFKS